MSTVWSTNPATGRMVIGADADDDTLLELFDAAFRIDNTFGDEDTFQAIEVLFDRDSDLAAAWGHLLRWTAVAEAVDLEVWWSFDATRSMALVTIIDPERVA